MVSLVRQRNSRQSGRGSEKGVTIGESGVPGSTQKSARETRTAGTEVVATGRAFCQTTLLRHGAYVARIGAALPVRQTTVHRVWTKSYKILLKVLKLLTARFRADEGLCESDHRHQ